VKALHVYISLTPADSVTEQRGVVEWLVAHGVLPKQSYGRWQSCLAVSNSPRLVGRVSSSSSVTPSPTVHMLGRKMRPCYGAPAPYITLDPMLNYVWRCFACDAANEPQALACLSCGCPAVQLFATSSVSAPTSWLAEVWFLHRPPACTSHPTTPSSKSCLPFSRSQPLASGRPFGRGLSRLPHARMWS